MPRPAYIVCSQLGSIDQYTNSISCFNIVEGLGAIAAPDGPDGQPATRGETFPPIRIVATWLRDEDESPDQKFESEIWVLFRSPQGEQPLGIGRYEPFSFSTRYYRCIVPEFRIPGVPGSGVLTVESRIRPVGQQEWTAIQSFPIVVEITQAPATEPQPRTENPPPPQPPTTGA